MHGSIRKKVLVGFGVSLLIFIGIGIRLFNCFESLIEAQELQAKSHQVIEKVQVLVTKIQDAQRGQRGYVITGDPSYLEPYFNAKETIDKELVSIEQLTHDNLTLQKPLEQLKPKIKKEFTYFEQVINTRGSKGFEATVALVRDGKCKRLMNDILQLTVLMESKERILLESRSNEVKKTTKNIIAFTGIGSIIIILILGILYGLVHQEMALRQEISAKLREREERLIFALDGTNDGLWDWDMVTGTVYFSPKSLEMLGYNNDEIIGNLRIWEKLLHPEDIIRVKEAMDNHLGGYTEKYEAEMRLLSRSGDWKWILARGKTVGHDTYEKNIRMVGTLTDIHDKKRAEEALLISNEVATEAVRLKSQFLANMSHEIRTPMHGILGLSEIVLKRELDDEQRRNIVMIQSSGRSLLTIINDILDFSKIEAGKFELDLISFKLRECLEEIFNLLSQQAHQKGLELLYRVHTNVPNELMGDPSRLKQVINNLVGNAIKFTSSGEIILELKLLQQDLDKITLIISVSDTGIGLSTDQQHQIFEPFVQGDGSAGRRYGGTGLGLSICKNLVELMGGKIWAESEKHKGSIFYFTLELGIQEKLLKSLQPLEVQALKNLSVLIVDDNDANLYILKEIVSSYGMRAVTVNNGKEALEIAVNASQHEQSFPLAILDVNMSEMDGFTLAQKLKAKPGQENIKIILLTCSGEVGDGARCRAQGIEGYLTKPVGEQALIQTIQTILNPKANTIDVYGTPVTSHLLREHFPKLRILLAEDNEINQIVAKNILIEVGCSLVIANNGLEAIAKFESQTFDLILMDVHMPKMDGFEATEKIRKLETGTGHHMPIIALTANAIKGDCERCLEAGMDAYVAKPFQTHELLDAINSVSPLSFDSSTKNEYPLHKLTEASQPIDSDQILDVSTIKERLRGDEKLLNKVVELFSHQYPSQLQTIEQAIERRDNKKLSETAHGLKGAIGNFTQEAAYHSAFSLEKMGRDNDFSTAKKEFKVLKKEILYLEKALYHLTQKGFN